MVKSYTLKTKKLKTIKPSKDKMVFLFGPTSVGKTKLLTDICKDKFSVINADSIQVYKGLDIGSAKASKDIMEKIPHYLINILPPTKQFSVADFIKKADEACEDIYSKGRIPIISGGTAFYFKHFLYGLSEAPPTDPKVRKEIEKQIKSQGINSIYLALKEVDLQSYNKINPNDSYRIQRAYEVYKTCGKPLSSFSISENPRNNMEPLIIGLYRDNEEMQRRLRVRVDLMIKEGLLEEVRRLIREGAKEDWPGMQGIGYREFFEAIKNGETSRSEILSKIVLDSKHYAKRQYTFFRSFENVNWIEASKTQEIESLICNFIKNK
ncbi:MAG: tRNA (adenosine(37)-N6)-dimethylallyltransferase MiaA [Spirochaetaceae bacterium]|nr:tRNA (adenosine(37)-N6)-dimethylallyltransferase MiaA [Spirochaetaceae bacterium]